MPVQVALLFMTEASVGMLLTCRPEMKLRKGSPYLHLDVLLQGVLVLICSVLGLPWCMVSLPHSPMNVMVLGDTEEDDQGNALILKSRENRLPGLLSHILMLMLVGFASSWIAFIPIGAAFGFLLYMGTESLSENDLFERTQLFFTDPSLYPPHHYVRFVRQGIIHRCVWKEPQTLSLSLFLGFAQMYRQVSLAYLELFSLNQSLTCTF